jgi:hypothetical protein
MVKLRDGIWVTSNTPLIHYTWKLAAIWGCFPDSQLWWNCEGGQWSRCNLSRWNGVLNTKFQTKPNDVTDWSCICLLRIGGSYDATTWGLPVVNSNHIIIQNDPKSNSFFSTFPCLSSKQLKWLDVNRPIPFVPEVWHMPLLIKYGWKLQALNGGVVRKSIQLFMGEFPRSM